MAQSNKESEEARRVFGKAANKNDQRDAAYLIERKRIQKVNDEKTARLKALRLAKEAADKITADAAAAEKAANPKRTKKAKAVAETVTP